MAGRGVVSLITLGWKALLHIVFVTATEAKYSHDTEKEHKDEEGDQAAFFLRLVEAFVAFRIGTVPVCKSLIILITILLFAVLIAHSFSATFEEGDDSTASHCLVTIPVSLLLARRDSVPQFHLAVHAWSEGVSVLASIP